jgi:hypothetical protein
LIFALQYRTLLVEAVVTGGETVQVGAQAAWVKVLRHFTNDLRVAQEGQGKLPFRRLGHADCWARRRVRSGIKRLLLGSETQHVLTHGKIPVLVLR